ncbi:MAG: hypothetical protein IPK76_25090 [Lewinellaceae bacterium]|nr:hypothetical protein [Lewinellaceae bacterium]
MEQQERYYLQELDMLNRNLTATIHFRFGMGISLFVLSFMSCGAAFLTKHSSFFGFSALLMFTLMSADFVLIRSVYGYYYRASRILVEKLGVTEDNIFDMSMIFITFVKVREIHSVMNIENDAERFRALRRLPVTIPTFLGFFAPLIALIAESAMCYWSLQQSGWQM